MLFKSQKGFCRHTEINNYIDLFDVFVSKQAISRIVKIFGSRLITAKDKV